MDFLAEDSTPIQDRIDTAIEQLSPEGTIEIGVSFGPKERFGPVHCFLEFYGEELETEDIEVISDRMLAEGGNLTSSLQTGSVVSE